MDMGYYILDGHTPTYPRRVDSTHVGRVHVTTVFLGLDHHFGDEGAPLLFETMVFGGKLDQHMDRCSTWEEAEVMHEKMCAKVRGE